ncbi:MAG TPA: bifunctional phosphoribosyl-AMP cyclohydrolase/phosphoribosyl-ATP diphosphatase HisIE [Melioribacteraceae bacterium]|nr:bifunctional phosphoribosyl-AMP cyclohydrolase/phosphoribosyl-ATP diphosphatase HisIE [Melioribacteraceae bacterium]
MNIDNLNFDKMNGLIPAIIIDEFTNQVLMLGFVNEESYNKTIETGKVTFYSRTKNRLWTKGETSGNYLIVKKIITDCDNDSLLIFVNPIGNTCHIGNYSCFGLEKNSTNFLKLLFDLIKQRKIELPDNSYTTKLFLRGENRIIQKVGEEAVETIIAAKNDDKDEIINEVSDLIYHLFVMLVQKGININEISDKLIERHTK